MNNSTIPVIVVSCILSAVVAVAAAGIIAPPPPPAQGGQVATSGMSKADVEALLASQQAELDKKLAEQKVVIPQPVASTNTEGVDASALQAKDDEIAKLQKELDETTGRLLALEKRFDEYEASEQSRQLENLQDAGRGMMRQGMEQMMERAPEFLGQLSERMTDGMADRLGLDDSQKEIFGNRMTKNMEGFLDMMKKVQSGEMTQEQAREEMQRTMEETNDEMKQTLTPEQYEQFEQGGGANFWRQGGQGGGGFGGFGGNNRRQRGQGGQGGNNNGGGNGSGDGF